MDAAASVTFSLPDGISCNLLCVSDGMGSLERSNKVSRQLTNTLTRYVRTLIEDSPLARQSLSQPDEATLKPEIVEQVSSELRKQLINAMQSLALDYPVKYPSFDGGAVFSLAVTVGPHAFVASVGDTLGVQLLPEQPFQPSGIYGLTLSPIDVLWLPDNPFFHNLTQYPYPQSGTREYPYQATPFSHLRVQLDELSRTRSYVSYGNQQRIPQESEITVVYRHISPGSTLMLLTDGAYLPFDASSPNADNLLPQHIHSTNNDWSQLDKIFLHYKPIFQARYGNKPNEIIRAKTDTARLVLGYLLQQTIFRGVNPSWSLERQMDHILRDTDEKDTSGIRTARRRQDDSTVAGVVHR